MKPLLQLQTDNVDIDRIDDHAREIFHLVFDGLFQRFCHRLMETPYLMSTEISMKMRFPDVTIFTPLPPASFLNNSANVSVKRRETVSTMP